MRHVEFMKGIFMENIVLRTAKPSDADKLLEIYAPYVETTAITFEYEVPSVDEFRQRIENTLKKYPYIVAIKDDKIVGYAYAGTFKSRAAYDWDVELSVYLVRHDMDGKSNFRSLHQSSGRKELSRD